MDVKEYVEHPVAVRAAVWDGADRDGLRTFCGRSYVGNDVNGDVVIETSPSHDKVARMGDYIVERSNGRFDVMTTMDFNRKYEELRYV